MPANAISPLPLNFNLRNAEQKNTLYALDSEQEFVLEITNTSRADIAIPTGTEDGKPSLRLCFRPGILDLTQIESLRATSDEGDSWVVTLNADGDDFADTLDLKFETAFWIKAGQTLRVTISGLQSLPGGETHGSVVSLRYEGLSQSGATGLLSGSAAHHITVMHSARPSAKSVATRPFLSATIIGSGMVQLGAESVLTIRLDEEAALIRDVGAYGYGFLQGVTLQAYSVDAKLEVNALSCISLGKSSDNYLRPLQLENAGSGLEVTQAIGANLAEIGEEQTDPFLFEIKFVANGVARQANLRLAISGMILATEDDDIPVDDFTLDIPVQIGAVSFHDSKMDVRTTVAITGALTLDDKSLASAGSDYDLRLFQDHGWNFTIDDAQNSGSALRVGPSKGGAASDMTYLSVGADGAEIGSNTRAAPANLRLLSDKNHSSGVTFARGDHEYSIATDIKTVPGPLNEAQKVIFEKSPKEILLLMEFVRNQEDRSYLCAKQLFPGIGGGSIYSDAIDVFDDLYEIIEEVEQASRSDMHKERLELITQRLVEMRTETPPIDVPILSIGGNNIDGIKPAITVDYRSESQVTHVGINTSNPACDLDVNGDLQVSGTAKIGSVVATEVSGHGTIPIGGIIMWSGPANAPPEGWTLCDGREENGHATPNLVDRFVVGKGETPSARFDNDGWGRTEIAIGRENLPNFIVVMNFQTIGFSKSTDGSATCLAAPSVRGGNGAQPVTAWQSQSQNRTQAAVFRKLNLPDAASQLDRVDNSFQNLPIDIRPPYYALAYIMRTS